MLYEIKDILDSKDQSSVLVLLLLSPARSFSSAELATRLRRPIAKIRKAMSQLEAVGLLKSFTKQQRYYLLRAKHPMMSQIKQSLLKRQVKYEDELFVAIRRLGNVEAAFLSGIFTGQPDLPVDILLVGKVNLKKLDDFLKACKRMIGQEANYSVMSAPEFISRRDTFDRFIKDVFDYPHLVVVDKLKK